MPRHDPRQRVYLPATLPVLVRLVESGSMHTPGTGFAVTAAVREADPDGDDDQWEFEAFRDAAAACVALLDPGSGVLRRVVVSVDLDPADVAPADRTSDDLAGGSALSAVLVPDRVPRQNVAAVHVDDEHAAAVVARVLDGAPIRVLDDVALDWFDASELETLVDQVAST